MYLLHIKECNLIYYCILKQFKKKSFTCIELMYVDEESDEYINQFSTQFSSK